MTDALRDRVGHTPLYREIDALGGVASNEREQGYVEAVSDVLAILGRRGFTEKTDAASEMLEVLHEGRRAIGEHSAPDDCYATGPLTGDEYRDLVECPACSFIAMYDAVLAKIGATS